MTETPLWSSLNFVTARQVCRWARSAGVDVRFAPRVLAESLDWFIFDAVFAERHRGLGIVVRLLQKLGLDRLVQDSCETELSHAIHRAQAVGCTVNAAASVTQA